ncbi:MAG: hypothetical protein ACJAWL_003523 [Motiliproteus sp.]|jgi:hypothetical protein
MESILNITNLKSLLTFFHLAGLAVGVGGAWMLDVFIIKNMNITLSKDKYYIFEFISKFVFIGLVVLWFSGLAFIAYYYVYTPELLLNEKTWGKVFIVVVLSFNGLFIHKIMLKRIKESIGSSLLNHLGDREIRLMSMVGAVSVVSWLFPLILGVSETLNFKISAIYIIYYYLVVVVFSSIVAVLISTHFIKSKKQEARSKKQEARNLTKK